MSKDEAIIQLHCIVVDAEWLSPHMVEAIDMAIEALQRTSNAFPTHECVKPTHECVEPVGNSEQLNGTCANCKHYTEEHLCVFWSYFGFEPNDYCSRWEGEEND